MCYYIAVIEQIKFFTTVIEIIFIVPKFTLMLFNGIKIELD